MTDPTPPPPQPAPCTPLEQEVLDEYSLLLSNLNKLSTVLSSLAERPTAEILDGLRLLERKTSLVCTLLKASVYSIVLQQQIYGGEEGGRGGRGEGYG
ncbi:DASH complex subunit dad3 [Lecanora helva]